MLFCIFVARSSGIVVRVVWVNILKLLQFEVSYFVFVVLSSSGINCSRCGMMSENFEIIRN